MRITMPDGRTGIVEYPSLRTALYYRVQWDDGTESVIAPDDFEIAEKTSSDDERALPRPCPGAK